MRELQEMVLTAPFPAKCRCGRACRPPRRIKILAACGRQMRSIDRSPCLAQIVRAVTQQLFRRRFPRPSSPPWRGWLLLRPWLQRGLFSRSLFELLFVELRPEIRAAEHRALVALFFCAIWPRFRGGRRAARPARGGRAIHRGREYCGYSRSPAQWGLLGEAFLLGQHAGTMRQMASVTAMAGISPP